MMVLFMVEHYSGVYFGWTL